MCIFENDQWLVDAAGIRSKRPAPSYEIGNSRLLENNRTKTSYDLPVDMAEKSWVNVDMFNDAYRAAVGNLDPKDVDFARLEQSLVDAAAIRNKS